MLNIDMIYKNNKKEYVDCMEITLLKGKGREGARRGGEGEFIFNEVT